jgi:hypothetical protein
MTTVNEDQVAAEIDDLPVPELEEGFSARVLAMARAELAPAERPTAAARVRLAVRGALIPALLTSAAGCRAVLTVETVEEVFQAEPSAEASAPEAPAKDTP